jgi:integrase
MPRKPERRRRGQGSIFQRKGFWWFRLRLPTGKRLNAKFATKDQAERVLKQKIADVAAGRDVQEVPRAARQTIGKLAEAWLDRRDKTHRSANEDRWRWGKHLEPAFGRLTPDEVDAGAIRRFIEQKLAEGLSSSTVRLLVAEVSTLFADLVEQGHAKTNPCRALPRATRRLIRPAHDPRTTPFVEKLEDVRRIFLALPEPVNVAYALGALGMLRNGEALALRWEHVDLDARRLHVRESTEGPLKDVDSRIVPIQDALLPLLRELKLKSGGKGTVVRSMHADARFLDGHTIRAYLKDALEELGLPPVTWYQATRHTGASHWVMSGGSIEMLRQIMGHSSVQMTERYAHLHPSAFGDRERAAIRVSLASGGAVAKLPPREEGAGGGDIGHPVATGAVS